MRMEMNGNKMSMETDGIHTQNDAKHSYCMQKKIKNNLGFLFGIIALLISILNISFSFGLIYITDFLGKISSNRFPLWIIFLFVLSLILILVSIIISAFSIIFYVKSNRQEIDKMSVILVVLSFIFSVACLVFDIIGLTA